MLKWIITFVLFAAVVGFLDYKDVAGTPLLVEQAVFYILVILFFGWLVARIVRGARPKPGK
jgi:uncharacterized membrane protein YtjA (UPF0391 family)